MICQDILLLFRIALTILTTCIHIKLEILFLISVKNCLGNLIVILLSQQTVLVGGHFHKTNASIL